MSSEVLKEIVRLSHQASVTQASKDGLSGKRSPASALAHIAHHSNKLHIKRLAKRALEE